MTNPNEEPVIGTAELHAIEHLGATFLRNHSVYQDKVLYYGPMGCRTGFYLLLSGDFSSRDILPLMKEMHGFIANYQGDIPGADPKDCGNYLDLNLPMAKLVAKKYLNLILDCIKDEQLVYPN
jgi:S-ribosylhomocysteine lyase